MCLQRRSVLPRSTAKPSSKSSQLASHANRPEKRLQQSVLIADDTTEFRHGLRPELEQAGYRVLEAAANNEALQIMADERVDVLLVDLVMPGLNGLELLRQRRRQSLPKVQTIALTGAQSLDAKLRLVFRSLGVSRFIAKPFEIGELLEAIEGGRFTAGPVATHQRESEQ